MNGIENIKARIRADAEADCADLLQEARENAAAITAEYEARAREAAAEEKERSGAAAVQRLERLESAARMDARKLLLSTKQDCIRDAFDRALAQLCALPEEKYIALLAELAVKASRTGREEIVLSPKDRETVGARVVAEANRLRSGTEPAFAVSGKADTLEDIVKDTLKSVGNAVAAAVGQIRSGTAFTLAEETREMAGGLILKDGNIEINCAFETRLRFLQECMVGEVADILFS